MLNNENPGSCRKHEKNESNVITSSVPRVLIVEDDQECAEMVEEFLKHSGYDARSAHDGASGLAAIASFDPHFVLLDVKMPRVDGVEFARHLRLNDGHFQRVVIFTTGLPRYAVKAEGADRYLAKPIEFSELLAILEEEWQAKFVDTPWCV